MQELKRLGITVSVAFTVLTLISVLWNLGLGRETDTYFHQLMRFIICLVGFGSIRLYQWFLTKLDARIALGLHYVATMLMVIGLTWLSSLVVSLHPQAYRDIALNFSVVYAVVAVIEIWRRGYFRKTV